MGATAAVAAGVDRALPLLQPQLFQRHPLVPGTPWRCQRVKLKGSPLLHISQQLSIYNERVLCRVAVNFVSRGQGLLREVVE